MSEPSKDVKAIKSTDKRPIITLDCLFRGIAGLYTGEHDEPSPIDITWADNSSVLTEKDVKPKLLMVEDSRFFGKLLKQKIESKLGHPVFWAPTYAEAKQLLEQEQGDFFLGLLDLNLPDSKPGEVVDLVGTYKIPAVVFTAELSNDIREDIWAKNVADYVIKQGSQDIEYVLSTIKRLYANAEIKILLVDDSRFSREHMARLLTIHRYQILQAENGEQALNTLKEHPDIHLVIADYNMPGMNGDELTRRIRNQYSHEDLSIIGISAQGNSMLSAKFIKSGANDFIIKPFISEEFYCRVSQNVEMMANIKTIRDLSNRDYLTNLYNRRYFFETAKEIFSTTSKNNGYLALGMVDIDDFKSVNDTYGHDAGDAVLCRISSILQGSFQEPNIVARVGGEEFNVLVPDIESKDATGPFEKARLRIEAAELKIGDETLHVTVSIGVCTQKLESLSAMITNADQLLYKAKESGKNRVVSS